MKSSEFRRTVNLPDARRRKILDAVGALPGAVALAHQGTPDGPASNPRDFDIGIAISQSDRPTSHFAVTARSTSQHSLCILHSGFLHTGTRCTIYALRGAEPAQLASGDVRWVHHIDGGVHAIGIGFDTPFDTRALVSPDAPKRAVKPAALSDIRGRVLVIDVRKADAELARRHLQAVGLDVVIATDSTSALAAMSATPPDVIVCELDLDAGMTGEVAVKLFSRRGFSGPVVILTGEGDQARLDAVRDSGVAAVVRKPCERKALLVAVTSALVRAGAIKARVSAPALPPLRSTLTWSADSDHLVTMYIEEARSMALCLASALEANDRNTIRRTCLALRGSAVDYGFEPLADAAKRAIDAVSKGAEAAALSGIVEEIRVLASRLAPSNRAA